MRRRSAWHPWTCSGPARVGALLPAVSLPDDPSDPHRGRWHFVQGILLKEALQKHERLLDEYEADVEDFVYRVIPASSASVAAWRR